MKRLSLAIALTLFTLPLFGQTATLGTPITYTTATQYQVVDLVVKRDCACGYTIVELQDSGSAAKSQQRFDVPDSGHPSATLSGLVTAMETVRTTETGTVIRKMNFRILGFYLDNGYFPAGTTLVP